MKRLFAMLVMAALSFSLVACSFGKDKAHISGIGDTDNNMQYGILLADNQISFIKDSLGKTVSERRIVLYNNEKPTNGSKDFYIIDWDGGIVINAVRYSIFSTDSAFKKALELDKEDVRYLRHSDEERWIAYDFHEGTKTLANSSYGNFERAIKLMLKSNRGNCKIII